MRPHLIALAAISRSTWAPCVRGRAGATRPGKARLPARRAGRHGHARILRLGARDTCRGRAGRRLAESAWRPPRAQPGQCPPCALPRQGVLALLGQAHPGRMLRGDAGRRSASHERRLRGSSP